MPKTDKNASRGDLIKFVPNHHWPPPRSVILTRLIDEPRHRVNLANEMTGILKVSICCAAAVSAVFICFRAHAQGLTASYQVVLHPGQNLIANQLSYKENKLSQIIPAPPDGTTVAKWDPLTQSFTTPSVYSTTTGWSIDYTLTYGEGALIVTPVIFTNTFIGQLWPGFDPDTGEFTPPLIVGPGVFLLSAVVPIENPQFHEIVGRAPQEGEWVKWLDPVTQIYYTSTFLNGVWTMGYPALGLGQAAFFGLIPEPNILALGCIPFGLLLAKRISDRMRKTSA